MILLIDWLIDWSYNQTHWSRCWILSIVRILLILDKDNCTLLRAWPSTLCMRYSSASSRSASSSSSSIGLLPGLTRSSDNLQLDLSWAMKVSKSFIFSPLRPIIISSISRPACTAGGTASADAFALCDFWTIKYYGWRYMVRLRRRDGCVVCLWVRPYACRNVCGNQYKSMAFDIWAVHG